MSTAAVLVTMLEAKEPVESHKGDLGIKAELLNGLFYIGVIATELVLPPLIGYKIGQARDEGRSGLNFVSCGCFGRPAEYEEINGRAPAINL